MKIKSTAAIAITFLSLAAGAANAKPTLAPSVVTPEAADKTIVIKESTKQVNVFGNETVLFKIGTKQFAITFDGVKAAYNLDKLAPDGLVDHTVRVYVTPTPGLADQGS
jgi:hypothetical protein